MRHAKRRHQLNRFTSWNKATLKSLARNLLLHESIKTTKARALAVRPLFEKLITLGKENTLTARRRAFTVLGDHALVKLLFDDIAKRFIGRTGGYIRILSLGKRRGDDAEIVIFELTEIKAKKKAKSHKEAKGVQAETQEIQEAEIKEETPHVHHEERQKHHEPKKPSKKFLGGLRSIFKKERDSL